ncbi:class I SAM-dependent methyltransferase [Deminuibacter soli]|uniref:Methyltransferase domain-containing protein n=1 Tax=Deminuibacter soli TaxID=2291815 RepID=A0A3E1NK10_9BACT|nr:methyltransferase domain-containing protein [Deminuibacter soli]RFM28270.1 methyltransferase domain-containing protein [Deminuibacter soli]
MKQVTINHDTAKAAEAFTRQSAVFDQLYAHNAIIQYKRDRVRNHINRYLQPNSHILELNAGTGEDAGYFARQGHRVHATDISSGMLERLQKKMEWKQTTAQVSSELCSFTQLDQLQQRGPYDLIFSNFAGLNCTGELDKVIHSFPSLLKPGALVTMVVMPGFCLWETMLALRGRFKLAFRRFNHKNGVTANVEGVKFTCWYYQPSFIRNCAQHDFEVLAVEGLCTIVPPSYLEKFPAKHPWLFRRLMRLENRFKNSFPWRHIGDYYIITLRKKTA